MAKSRRTIVANLPAYERPRSQWRKNILANVLGAADGVRYERNDPLEVVVLLYLTKGKRHMIHDVDNRLKDILDALQGRFGSSRVRGSERCLIANDNQVRRVLIEKQEIPKKLGDDAGGRILIRPYLSHRWPLQTTKGHALVKTRNWVV
jgi:Holliday junction resolvase RusA-like endonuclease